MSPGRARGIDRDRKVRDLLDDQGWFAICACELLTALDALAIRVYDILQSFSVRADRRRASTHTSRL